MKIQMAVDRVSIEKATEIIDQAKDHIDIIEIGTSLFKDFGLKALTQISSKFDNQVLADIKTMDEADYEFRQIYRHGGDIATVMGASALETIRLSQKVAQEYDKDYMVDLMEVSDDKIDQLKEFDDAIFCLHLPTDKDGDLQEFIKNFTDKHQVDNRLAVAGGVKKEDIPLLKELGIDIAIVGSAITKSEDIEQAAKEFKELI